MKPRNIVSLLLAITGLALIIPGAVLLAQGATCDVDTCPDTHGAEVPLFIIGALLLGAACIGCCCWGSRGSSPSGPPVVDPEAARRMQDRINAGNQIAQQQATYDAWQANNYQQMQSSIQQNSNWLNNNYPNSGS